MDPSTTQTGDTHDSARPDFDAAYRALTAGAGYRVARERLVIRMTGDDRVLFLNGMCSNDIKQLAPGSLVPALILTEHAHVVAEIYVWAKTDALLIEADRASWPATREQLEKFLVADDVEMEELTETAVIDIEGPSAAAAVAGIAGESTASLARWKHLESGKMDIANLPRFGGPGFTVLAENASGAEIVKNLEREAASLGIREVGAEALEVVRIENGIARIGVDTGPKTIALEARLQPAISFSKGCYVGQETIERATSRGGLKKRLFGLRVTGSQIPQVNAAVMLEGKEIGRITSAVLSPRLGVLALSILHHSAWNVGTQVTIEDSHGELSAAVSDLPF